MKYTFVIPQNYLKAVAHAAPATDIRYYLNGVLLEWGTESGKYRLVSSDGHRLHLAEGDLTQCSVKGSGQFIIPIDMVKSAIKVKSSASRCMITIEYDTDTKMITAKFPSGIQIQLPAIDGKFPEYTRIIPKEISGEYAPLNWEYVIDAEQGMRDYLDIKKSSPMPKKIGMNGDGPAVLCCNGFIAVVMPMRSDVTETVHQTFTEKLK